MSSTVNLVIECQGVGFHYGKNRALQDISFAISEGEYVGIVGGNGSGKTTLLKIILGLLSPSQGEVRIFGQKVSEFKDWDKIGYVPQNVFRGDLGFPATVREVIESGHLQASTFWCRFGTQGCVDVLVVAKRCGVDHLLKKRIGELSGGERQRVFIARALVSAPRLLILDEPTAGIDSETEEQFYAFINELHLSGLTVVLVSHDLEAVRREVGMVLCLNRRLVCHGKPESLEQKEVLEALYGNKKNILHHEHNDHV